MSLRRSKAIPDRFRYVNSPVYVDFINSICRSGGERNALRSVFYKFISAFTVVKRIVMCYGDDRSVSCELLCMIRDRPDEAVILYSGTSTVYGDFERALLHDGAIL